MKTTISGKNIIKSMKAVAKEYLEDYNNPSCVTVGVVNVGKLESSGRTKKGGERTVYVGVSGATGRTLLRNTLIADGIQSPSGGVLTSTNVTNFLTDMANTALVKYRSKQDGPAINRAELWTTHNCAESNLALYLFKNGKDFGRITIASYERNNGAVQYKALCNNCKQWCEQTFQILGNFKDGTRNH